MLVLFCILPRARHHRSLVEDGCRGAMRKREIDEIVKFTGRNENIERKKVTGVEGKDYNTPTVISEKDSGPGKVSKNNSVKHVQ